MLVAGPTAGAEMQASFDQFWTHRRAVPLTRLKDVSQRVVADAGEPADLVPPANLDGARVERCARARSIPKQIRRLFVDTALRVGHVEYFSDSPDKPDRPGAPRRRRSPSTSSAPGARAARSPVQGAVSCVLSERARKVFRDLYKREPRVPVVVSTNSLAATDAFYVYALSHKYKKRYLKRYGFEIHEFKPFPATRAQFVRDYEALAGGANARTPVRALRRGPAQARRRASPACMPEIARDRRQHRDDRLAQLRSALGQLQHRVGLHHPRRDRRPAR